MAIATAISMMDGVGELGEVGAENSFTQIPGIPDLIDICGGRRTTYPQKN